MAQLGLIKEPCGSGVGVDLSTVECPPLAVDAFNEIRNQDMGMQMRIAVARRPVAEPRGDQSPCRDHLDAVVSSTCERRVLLDVSQRGVDGSFVSDANG